MREAASCGEGGGEASGGEVGGRRKLSELYPSWCIDLYLTTLVKCKDFVRVLQDLWLHQEAVQKWLSRMPLPPKNLSQYKNIVINFNPEIDLHVVKSKLTPVESEKWRY
jgi:hypothetical protein